MKLLIITDAWHPQVNGVVRTYEHLSQYLIDKGHDVRIISPSDFTACIPMPGYSEIKLPFMPYRRLKMMIEEFAPDAIHLPTEGPLGFSGRRYCLKHKRFYTSSYHTQFPDYVAKRASKYVTCLYKTAFTLAKMRVTKFHSRSAGIMIATQSLEDQLRSWGFKAPIHRVTRGANIALYTPGEGTLLKDMKAPIALYVGRVAIEKNIEAFLNMEWAGSKVIVGSGPSLHTLKERYPDAHFAGVKSAAELVNYYRSADVFVFPSRTDTFGLVLVEALACGLPVAGFYAPGPQDIVTEPFLGGLHEDDLGAAAAAALACEGSAAERVAFVKDHYTWSRAGEQFEAALLQTIKEAT